MIAARGARYRQRLILATWWVVLLEIATGSVSAQQGYRAELVAGGLNHPIYATHAPGDPDALYVVQQRDGPFGADLFTGTIERLDLTSGTTTPFVQLTGLDNDTQGGLHSLAFHPDYQPGVEGSKMYVVALKPNVSNSSIADNHLEEWVLDSSGDPQFNRTIMQIPGLQPGDATHAMNWVGFRPGAQGAERDYLYVSMGDGGTQANSGSFVNNPQDLNSLYGKVLRLGVGGADDRPESNLNYGFTPTVYHNDAEVAGATAPEVFYSGLRNPWRVSFDRETSDVYIGDVGFFSYEEVNFIEGGVIGRDSSGNPASPGDGAAKGIDFGWARREGFLPEPSGPNSGDIDPDGPGGIRPDSVDPVAVYSHGGADPMYSITGGYVYRGPDQNANIQGKYFYSGFVRGTSYAGSFDNSGDWQFQDITSDLSASLATAGLNINRISSYAEDSAGNLYLLDFGDGCGGGCTGEDGWQGVLTQFGTGEIYKITYGAVPEPTAIEPALTLRDDFDQSHNYETGDVPNGGIWTGVYNEANGGDSFDANINNAGQLTVGIQGVGWENENRTDGRMLYREVDAESFVEVQVKISQQTMGLWSAAGLIVRAAGALNGPEAENFITAHSFRATGPAAILSNIVNGVEDETGLGVSSDDDLMFIRLVNNGLGEFEMFTSDNGTDWVSRVTKTNPALASGDLEIGLWAGSFVDGVAGTAQFDFAEIILGVPAGDYNENGVIDAADYTVWRDTLGDSIEPWSGADGDGDGMITQNDYTIWKANFGKPIPDLQAGFGSSLTPVPEPNGCALLLIAAAVGAIRAGHDPRSRRL